MGAESCPVCHQSWLYRHKTEGSDELYCQACGFERVEKLERLRPPKPIEEPPAPSAWREDKMRRESGTKKNGGKKKHPVFDS